jgi:hypothetical protein
MTDTPDDLVSPEDSPVIQAAIAAHKAQQAAYEKEEAERWALLQVALDNCAQEMAKREEAYAEAMGDP